MAIDNLKKYQWAHAAAAWQKDRPDNANQALGTFYYGLGLEYNDPALENMFKENGSSLKKAIKLYGGKFSEAQAKATVGEIIDYTKDAGYDCSDIKDETNKILDKYKDQTVEEIAKKKKEAEEAKDEKLETELMIVLETIGRLDKRVVEGQLYAKMIKEETKKGFGGLEDLAKKLSEA